MARRPPGPYEEMFGARPGKPREEAHAVRHKNASKAAFMTDPPICIINPNLRRAASARPVSRSTFAVNATKKRPPPRAERAF